MSPRSSSAPLATRLAGGLVLLGILLAAAGQGGQAGPGGQAGQGGQAPAKEPPRKDVPTVDCKTCGSAGRRDCLEHGKTDLLLEREPYFCSQGADCKKCGGTTWIDCPVCTNPPIEKENAQTRKDIAEWVAARRKKVDDYMKHPCLHLTSEHADLVFDLKPMKVGLRPEKVPTHELGHIYVKRIDEARALFLKTLEATERDFSARTEVYMWRAPQDQALAAPKFAGIGASGQGVKMMGSVQVYSMVQDGKLRDDEAVHRNLVHSLSHLFLGNLAPAQWIGNLKCGWVDEGLAHWFEYQHSQKCTNYCYEEISTDVPLFKSGKYKSGVRKLVESGKLPSFAQVSKLNSDQLSPIDHALAFAYVDFLLTVHGGKKFREMCTGLKQKRPLRDVLKEVYSLDPLSIDPVWREWVLKTYPVLEKDKDAGG